MKRRMMLVVLVIAVLAGFGSLLHSPPSVMSAISGATPKSKKITRETAQLEGRYIFGMNPDGEILSDDLLREKMKNIISEETDPAPVSETIQLKLYVSEEDYALLNYAQKVCERLKKANIDVEVRTFSGTMMRSRVASRKYEMFLASTYLINVEKLERVDYEILDSNNMRGTVE